MLQNHEKVLNYFWNIEIALLVLHLLGNPPFMYLHSIN